MIFRRKAPKPRIIVVGDAAKDETVARLTVRADMILEELDGVVKQMSTMLKESVNDRT
jgi:hypothetical protein